MTRPVVLVTEGCDPTPLAWLRERAEVLEIPPDDPRFSEARDRAQGLVVRTYTKVTEEFLSGAPNLKVVARGGVGLENIDIPACRRRGIEVVYTPDANTLAVGDYIFGILLRLIRDWPFLEAGYKPEQFKQARNAARGRQLDELTLGILGLGRVGKRVATIAACGFAMPVIYNDIIDPAPPGTLKFPATPPATPVDKPTLYRTCDILTIHVDMRPENHNLVGAQQLALMKPTAILVNASRGEVLDTNALATALREKKLAAAALDVYAPEPPPADFPLLGMPNVLLTPHLASRTHTAIENMSWVVRDVIEVLEGRPPKHPAPAG